MLAARWSKEWRRGKKKRKLQKRCSNHPIHQTLRTWIYPEDSAAETVGPGRLPACLGCVQDLRVGSCSCARMENQSKGGA